MTSDTTQTTNSPQDAPQDASDTLCGYCGRPVDPTTPRCEGCKHAGMDLVPDHSDLQRFTLAIAQLTKDGEDNGDGDEFIMENDDAIDTLDNLISEAREMFGLPFRNDPPTDLE